MLMMQMLHELQAKWDLNLLLLPGVCELFPVVFLTTQYLSPQRTTRGCLLVCWSIYSTVNWVVWL